MGLFVNGQGGFKLPATNKLLVVLQGANQTSRVSDSDLVSAFERFVEAGNTTFDLFNAIQELLDEAGFFCKDKKETEVTNGESLDNEPEAPSELL